MNSSCRVAIVTKLCRFSGSDEPTQPTRHRTIENVNKRPVFPDSLFLMIMIEHNPSPVLGTAILSQANIARYLPGNVRGLFWS